MYRLRDNKAWTLTCWKNGTSGSVLGKSPDIYHSITLVQINSEPSFLKVKSCLILIFFHGTANYCLAGSGPLHIENSYKTEEVSDDRSNIRRHTTPCKLSQGIWFHQNLNSDLRPFSSLAKLLYNNSRKQGTLPQSSNQQLSRKINFTEITQFQGMINYELSTESMPISLC
jgi:hypothetical protein